MKNLKFALALMFMVMLSSCLDCEEKIIVNADNSGIYSMTLDLGKMLEMVASMGTKAENNKPKEKKDTVVYLKKMLDSADNLTAEEKALYKEGSLSVNLDEEKSLMKIIVSCPFKTAADLISIKNKFFTIIKN